MRYEMWLMRFLRSVRRLRGSAPSQVHIFGACWVSGKLERESCVSTCMADTRNVRMALSMNRDSCAGQPIGLALALKLATFFS